jgi:hypothetical protein
MTDRKSPQESATLYKIGTKKKGNDNNIWIIAENKNGVKRWMLYKKTNSKKTSKTNSKKTSKTNSKKNNNIDDCNSYDDCADKKKIMSNPNDYYKQFSNYKKPVYDTSFFTDEIKSLQNDFKKIGVLFFFLKWAKDSLYFGHTAHIFELIDKKHGKQFNTIYPNGWIYTSDALLHSYAVDKEDAKIYLHHQVTNKIINNVNQILISHFPKRTIGIQYSSDAIIINMKEKNKILKTKEHIKWMVKFMFENKKITHMKEDMPQIIKFALRNLGKKIINRLDDAYNFKGHIILFFSVYNDKLDEFVNKIKNLKIPLMPKIKKIIIMEGDEIILKKNWIFEY